MGGVYRIGKQRRALRRRSRLDPRTLLLLIVATSSGALAGTVFIDADGTGSLPRVHSYGGGQSTSTVHRSTSSGTCNIKGNISAETGERIFHVPGQKYYAETVVNPLKGERWFCSEADARAAGWRKAKV